MLGRNTQSTQKSALDAAEQYAAEARKHLTAKHRVNLASSEMRWQYAQANATLAIYELLKAQIEQGRDGAS
jgi:hypothetical protein